jgi:alpha-D-ribose 1-methylphosphonate 5-triphosphate synthase subunit PhnL
MITNVTTNVTTEAIPLVRVAALRKHFPMSGRTDGGLTTPREVNKAVDDVSFDIQAGETLGLVGESGSGKSTLGRVVVGLMPATSGQSVIAGQSVAGLRGKARKALWRHAQMVFQDPYSSLNPRMTVQDALAEPLRNFGIARGVEADRQVRGALDACGLSASAMTRYPREFSGGGDVSRQAGRNGAGRGALCAAAPSLYAIAAPLRAGAGHQGGGRATAVGGQRRSDQSPGHRPRLPVQRALPHGAVSNLYRESAAARGAIRRPFGRLPFRLKLKPLIAGGAPLRAE